MFLMPRPTPIVPRRRIHFVPPAFIGKTLRCPGPGNPLFFPAPAGRPHHRRPKKQFYRWPPGVGWGLCGGCLGVVWGSFWVSFWVMFGDFWVMFRWCLGELLGELLGDVQRVRGGLPPYARPARRTGTPTRRAMHRLRRPPPDLEEHEVSGITGFEDDDVFVCMFEDEFFFGTKDFATFVRDEADDDDEDEQDGDFEEVTVPIDPEDPVVVSVPVRRAAPGFAQESYRDALTEEPDVTPLDRDEAWDRYVYLPECSGTAGAEYIECVLECVRHTACRMRSLFFMSSRWTRRRFNQNK